jgi:DNA processing protein
VSPRGKAAGACGTADARGTAGARDGDTPPGACADCRRRSWLLAALSGPLDYCARDRDRLLALLALDDGALIEAVGGRRRAQLRERYDAQEACASHEQPAASICRHDRRYPRALASGFAPRMLELDSGARRLTRLTAAPVVAVVGSCAPSDYGVELARGLARGLSASGVTVVAAFADGIAAAAHAGTLDAGAGSVAVLGGGLGVARPPRRRELYERVLRAGCGVSELPRDCAGRRWGPLASERIVAELASLTVVVEADASAGDLAPARVALALGRAVAAIPGRVTSPLSRGTHALLLDGARLVRGPRDVLELLYELDAPRAHEQTRERTEPGAGEHGVGARASGKRLPAERLEVRAPADPHPALAPELRATLAQVGAGRDTPDRLARAGLSGPRLLLALSELELMGLLVRGDGARYLPRYPLDD